MLYDIQVTHPRERWKSTEVLIDVPDGLTNKQYEELAREWLYRNEYKTYCFVTEYPRPRENYDTI